MGMTQSEPTGRTGEPTRPGRATVLGSAALAAGLTWFAIGRSPDTWLVEYYPNRSLRGDATRTELLQRPGFPSDVWLSGHLVDREDFSLRFRACLRLLAPGSFVFRLMADEGARLYVDDEVAADAWELPSGRPGKTLQLGEGAHRVTIEYFNTAGAAALRVEMAEPGVYGFRNLEGQTELPGSRGECDTI
jgi:hypothetical protein